MAKALLVCGAIAGPLFTVAWLVEGATRAKYNRLRHPISSLATFGVLLLSVASASRAPRTLRVVAFIPLVAGIATPFVGVERAPAIIEWWSQQGSGVVRVTAVLVLALGGFFAYACAPARRAV